MDQNNGQTPETIPSGITKESKSILDSLRDTVRNNPLIMALALVVAIGTGCSDKGSCGVGVVGGYSCSGNKDNDKKKDPTYKELKKDTSDL